jgi:putative PIN family toxin of toxin-antitoxin system
MKVILDANIIISYLLSKRETGAVTQAVHRCLESLDITLVFPQELQQEILEARAKKEFLRRAIPLDKLENLLRLLVQVAEVPATIEEWTLRTRDPKDDYLIAYGLVGRVDYLITGDEDLLVLQQIQGLKIVDPVEFIQLLEAH